MDRVKKLLASDITPVSFWEFSLQSSSRHRTHSKVLLQSDMDKLLQPW